MTFKHLKNKLTSFMIREAKLKPHWCGLPRLPDRQLSEAGRGKGSAVLCFNKQRVNGFDPFGRPHPPTFQMHVHFDQQLLCPEFIFRLYLSTLKMTFTRLLTHCGKALGSCKSAVIGDQLDKERTQCLQAGASITCMSSCRMNDLQEHGYVKMQNITYSLQLFVQKQERIEFTRPLQNISVKIKKPNSGCQWGGLLVGMGRRLVAVNNFCMFRTLNQEHSSFIF